MPIRTDRRMPFSQRQLALAGVVAPAVFALGVVVAGLTWPGYNHRTHNISDLGGTEAPYPTLLNLSLVLFGLLVVAFSVGLHQRRIGAPPTPAGPLLVGYLGLMAVVQGVTPCTPGCAEGTLTDLVHGLAATTGFLAVSVGMLLFWRATRSQTRWSTHGALSAWTGVLALGFLVAWLIAGAVDPERLYAGVLQRTIVAMVLIWLGATGARLLHLDRDQPRTRTPTA